MGGRRKERKKMELKINFNKYWLIVLWPGVIGYFLYRSIRKAISNFEVPEKDDLAFVGFCTGLIGFIVMGFIVLCHFTWPLLILWWAFCALGTYSLWWHLDYIKWFK